MSNHQIAMPIRLKTDPNVIYLLGVGFVRIPVGIHLTKRHGRPVVRTRLCTGHTYIVEVDDLSGQGWQRAIYKAAKERARYERLMGRRNLRMAESRSKERPLGIVGVFADADEVVFNASCRDDKEVNVTLHDAAAFRLREVNRYNRRWTMSPKSVLRPLW